jgi:hypothetical protein
MEELCVMDSENPQSKKFSEHIRGEIKETTRTE